MPSFFFNDTATTEIYTLSHTTLFRSIFHQIKLGVFLPKIRAWLGTFLASVRRHRSEEHTSELQLRQYLVCRLFFLMIRRPPRSTLFPTRRSSDLSSTK